MIITIHMTITYMISHGSYNFRDERNNTKKEYAISGFPSNKNILTKIGQRKLSFPGKSYISII